MERYTKEIPVVSNNLINRHPSRSFILPIHQDDTRFQPKCDLKEPSSAGKFSKLKLISPSLQTQQSRMRVPISSRPFSALEIKKRMETFLKEEFKGVPLRDVAKYHSPEDGKEEILVFIKVERHPYRTIKEIYKKLQEKDPELAEIVQLLPSFD